MPLSRLPAPAITDAASPLSPTKSERWPRRPKGRPQAQTLATQIQEQVRSIAAAIKAAADGAAAEVENSQTVILALGDLRKEASALSRGKSNDCRRSPGSRSGFARGSERRGDHFVRGRGAGGRGRGNSAQYRAADCRAKRKPERRTITCRYREQSGRDVERRQQR